MSFFYDGFTKIKSRIRSDKRERKSSETWTGSITKRTDLKECPFVVFDTELSGLNPRKDFIVSIGAIKMTGGTIHINREFYRLIKPLGTLQAKSVEIHGITPGELEQQEDRAPVLREFLAFIKDSVLVGHFVNIDVNFVNAALRKEFNEKLDNPAVDTHDIHHWLSENGIEFKKHYRGGSVKTDLFSVARRYGITIDSAHDALKDAFITAQLFQKFLYFLHAEGMHTLNDLLDVGRA